PGRFTLNSIAGTALIPDLELPFPLGLSYYTLQAIAYIVDVHRGKTAPQRDPILFAIHIAAFPQITVGPIVRYGSIEAQLTDRHPTSSDIADGLRRFIIGLAKKVLLADVCAPLAADLFHMSPKRIGALGAWSAITSITFQLYFDFSGYSDMAVGLGKMLGFTYPENFDHPFAAESYSDLWRRWHMSLMGFFRDYVYFPLGGSRVPSARHIANIMVVWLFTGMWHGASWNFIAWGLLNGILLVGERYLWGESFSKLPRVIRSIVCTLLFMLTFVFFSINDITQVPAFLLALIGGFGFSGLDTPWQLNSWEYLPVLVVCIIAASPIVPWLKQRFLEPTYSDIAPTDGSPTKPGPVLAFVRDAALLCLLVIAIAGVISNSFTPSMYARF
ncbi:MAG: MBOAT family protein, partial [Atopobiaceae bacterium]|nr:MBOAT family protein [Atopobiaceae bacterium]